MDETWDRRDPPAGPTLRVPIDTVTKDAGALALVTAVLSIAGILSTGAHLAAWRAPIPMVKLTR